MLIWPTNWAVLPAQSNTIWEKCAPPDSSGAPVPPVAGNGMSRKAPFADRLLRSKEFRFCGFAKLRTAAILSEIPNLARIVQLVRTLLSHGRGHRSESCCAHHFYLGNPTDVRGIFCDLNYKSAYDLMYDLTYNLTYVSSITANSPEHRQGTHHIARLSMRKLRKKGLLQNLNERKQQPLYLVELFRHENSFSIAYLIISYKIIQQVRCAFVFRTALLSLKYLNP